MLTYLKEALLACQLRTQLDSVNEQNVSNMSTIRTAQLYAMMSQQRKCCIALLTSFFTIAFVVASRHLQQTTSTDPMLNAPTRAMRTCLLVLDAVTHLSVALLGALQHQVNVCL